MQQPFGKSRVLDEMFALRFGLSDDCRNVREYEAVNFQFGMSSDVQRISDETNHGNSKRTRGKVAPEERQWLKNYINNFDPIPL